MLTDRRSFLTSLAGAAVVPAFTERAIRHLGEASRIAGARPAAAVADDESYWSEIQRAFDADRTMINLNNGGCSPTPTHVLEQMIRDLRFSNELPVDHMWRVLEPRVESVRRDLAHEFGCDPEEMAIVRNSSEANEIVQYGLDLKRGDEVVVSNQNYTRMLTTWDQRARRDGIVVKAVRFPLPPPSQKYLADQFIEAFTPRTRAVELPHITNLSGQIMPVKEIISAARAKNIDVLVDGAHAFGHFPFTRDELGVDYYGTSLHKWLLAPIGTGFLYVKKDKQKSIWPLMATPASMDENIRKYEEIGTHPAANHNAIAAALAFHRGIGVERKVARLRFLRDRWAKPLLKDGNGRVKILTPLDSPDGAGICLVTIDGLKANDIVGWLHDKHQIVTTPINHPEFSGVRVTPNVYTTLDEIDRFRELMTGALRSGLSS